MRKADIKIHGVSVGWLTQDEKGYSFIYDVKYLQSQNPVPISLTLPLQGKAYTSNVLFPFFDGLIPEGWLLDIVESNWKLNPRDRMGLLMVCCKDCIGAVSVHPISEEEPQ
jgi:serine/threonine-protein kinase HipA